MDISTFMSFRNCEDREEEAVIDESSGERLNREELARLSLLQLQNRVNYLRKQLNGKPKIHSMKTLRPLLGSISDFPVLVS